MTAERQPPKILNKRYRIGHLRFRPSVGEAFDAFDLEVQEEVTAWILPRIRPQIAAQFFAVNATTAAAAAEFVPRVRDARIDAATTRAYVVFEPIRVGTLEETLKRRPRFPPDRASEVFLHLLGLLMRLRGHGIAHGRLNPLNILVGECSNAVIGFGLSFFQRVDDMPLALVAFLSPQQIAGHASTIECDLYAAALILFASLLGDSVFVTLAHSETQGGNISRTVELVRRSYELPEETRDIILRMLQCDPAQRWSVAQEAMNLLGRGKANPNP